MHRRTFFKALACAPLVLVRPKEPAWTWPKPDFQALRASAAREEAWLADIISKIDAADDIRAEDYKSIRLGECGTITADMIEVDSIRATQINVDSITTYTDINGNTAETLAALADKVTTAGGIEYQP